MFERFTDQARRVVVLAQEEARRLHHNYLGTEHLLLGLTGERDGLAARALRTRGITLEAAREQVTEVVGTGQGEWPQTGHIPFTPRVKTVLEQSLREALRLGHNHIGTEHLLLSLIGEPEGVGAQVLTRLGADLAEIRQQLIREAPEPGPAAVPRPARIPGLGRAGDLASLVSSVESRLASIDARLAAIERHLRLREGQPPKAGPEAG